MVSHYGINNACPSFTQYANIYLDMDGAVLKTQYVQ